jgi:hypothetical protein
VRPFGLRALRFREADVRRLAQGERDAGSQPA